MEWHRTLELYLTPSLPWYHLKATHNREKFETLQHFCLLSSDWREKVFSSKRIVLKIDVVGPEIYCLEARPCIFQPGNFTGWGSEGVKPVFIQVLLT